MANTNQLGAFKTAMIIGSQRNGCKYLCTIACEKFKLEAEKSNHSLPRGVIVSSELAIERVRSSTIVMTDSARVSKPRNFAKDFSISACYSIFHEIGRHPKNINTRYFMQFLNSAATSLNLCCILV